MLKPLRCLLFVISLWSLTSACTPKPPDVPACEQFVQHLANDPLTGDLVLTPSPTCMAQINEPSCGHCVYIVSGKEIFVGEKTLLNGKAWSQIRASAVILPAAESYAPLSAYIINACKAMNCNQSVDQFTVKLNSLSAIKSVTP